MKFVDAHVHLSDPDYEKQIDKVVEDAERSNVIALVSNSMNLQTSLESIELAERLPKLVYAAVGIHPWNVRQLLPDELERVVDLIVNHKEHERMVAIGEIGLDYKYVKGEKQDFLTRQYEVFVEMLQLGEKLSLPVIIHSRGTTSEIFDMLSSYNIERVLLHWFSEPIRLLSKIVDRGYYITEGPPTVYSKHIQNIIRQVPITNLLTETDGPVKFFKPPFKGKTTLPSHIPLVVDAISEIKNKRKEEIAEQIYQNFTIFFGVH